MFAKPHVFPQETPVCHCLLLVPPEFSQFMKNDHTFSSFSYHDLFLTLLSLYPTVVARRPYWSQWKWRRERNTLAKFSCAEEKNSCFIQKVLKERDTQFASIIAGRLPGGGLHRLSEQTRRKNHINNERMNENYEFHWMLEIHGSWCQTDRLFCTVSWELIWKSTLKLNYIT